MIINWLLGYMCFAIFISVVDRYFSGESYKMSEWVNGKSFKFKLGLAIVVSIAPYFFSGVSSDTLMVPFRVLGMVMGFYVGEFFIRSYDWAFKKPAPAAENNVQPPETAALPADKGSAETKSIPQEAEDASRKSVVEAIQGAGTSVKEGLKSLGDGIAKASENILKGDGKDEKPKNKDYEPNKNLDDKLNNY